MQPSDWISIVGILVAILAATWFASRQNRKILKQNLEIETYKEFWLAIESFNNALVEWSAFCNLQLNFLERTLTGPNNFGESDADADFRRRTAINKYNREFDEKIQLISQSWGSLHRLWEQKEPLLYGLKTAFSAYKQEYNKFQKKVIFPSKNRLNLDLSNFNTFKEKLEDENEILIEEAMELLVYGIDMSRLIQEKLLSRYYSHSPELRGDNAEVGYQLTKTGLVPVGSGLKMLSFWQKFKRRIARG